MTFMDHKQLTATINQLCGEVYRVLKPVELDEPLRLKEAKGGLVVLNENTLNKWDKYNIKHWQPKTVGDVVFKITGIEKSLKETKGNSPSYFI